MGIKLDINHFLKRARSVHGNKYDYSKVVYERSGKKVHIVCPIHGEFTQTPDNHYQGYGCSACGRVIAGKERSKYLKYTTKSFIEESKKVHGNLYSYEKTKYEGTNSLLTITCPLHGDFEQIPSYHLNGSGCPACSRRFQNVDQVYKHLKTSKKRTDRIEIISIKNRVDLDIRCVKHKTLNKVKFVKLFSQGNSVCDECRQEKIINKTFKRKNLDLKIVNIQTKSYTCGKHGRFKSEHKPYKGCPSCRLTEEEVQKAKKFEKRVKRVFAKIPKHNADKYDYSESYLEGSFLKNIKCVKHGYFDQWSSNHTTHGNGCPKCSAHRMSIWGRSKDEKFLFKKLKLLTPLQIKRNERNVIKGELDLYIPKAKLAIEIDGIYWHSTKFKDKNFHIDKMELCLSKGISLLQFFDVEIRTKTELVLSMIKSKLGISDIVYARKLEIKEVSSKEASEFLEINHIQGSCPSSIKLGLYEDDILCCLMTFGKPRFSNKHEWELIRYCSVLDTTVVGGAGRLLKYFERTYNPKSLISYANRRYSEGNLYRALNFDLVRKTNPGFLYSKGSEVFSRYALQKKKLKNILGDRYNDSISAEENLIESGFFKIWDSGNLVFEKFYN